jgi:hypothetical protein
MIAADLPDGAEARWLAGLDIDPADAQADQAAEEEPDYPTVDHTRPTDYGRTGYRGRVHHLRANPGVANFDDRSLCGQKLFVATIVPEGGRLCARCHRASQPTPCDADHGAYVHEDGAVTALYIPDRGQARDPRGTWARCRDSAWARASGVEVIGAIIRDGSRWRWEGDETADPFLDGDPATKKAALPGLQRAVAKHFTR